MGFLLRGSCRAPLVFCGPGYPECRDTAVPSRSEHARLLCAFWSAIGAVREGFLEASLVCLLVVAVEARGSGLWSTISTPQPLN